MQPAVRAAWIPFNRSLEGWVNWMYLDVKGLVTTGMGNLIDPVGVALQLPWKTRGGLLVHQQEIEAEWQEVKDNTALARHGAASAGHVTALRLDDQDVETLVMQKLNWIALTLSGQRSFVDFDRWPADAQLGLLSMAWAMGPGFAPEWPHFSAAMRAGDFAAAAENCEMNASGNAGLVRRNAANRMAFLCAAAATDPALLHSSVPPA